LTAALNGRGRKFAADVGSCRARFPHAPTAAKLNCALPMDIHTMAAEFERVVCGATRGETVSLAECQNHIAGVVSGGSREVFVKALQNLCARGLFSVAHWLTEAFGLTAADARAGDNAALRGACTGGHLSTARWLAARFGLTVDDARAGLNDALRTACTAGHLEVVKWLVIGVGLTVADVRAVNNFALRWACAMGSCDIARWLFEAVGLTAEDARADDNAALRGACQSGHLGVAKWLVETVGLTADDARSRDNEALRSACGNGFLDIAQWLVGTVGLTVADASASGLEALSAACKNGHLCIAQWWAETFVVAVSDGRHELAFNAYASGAPGILKWYAEKLSGDDRCRLFVSVFATGNVENVKCVFEKVDIGEHPLDMDHMFNFACELEHIELAKWVVDTFGNRKESCFDLALVTACKQGRVKVAQWLCSAFYPTTQDAIFALNRVREHGIHTVAGWLVSHHALTAADVRGKGWAVLGHSRDEAGNFVDARWLVETFNLSELDRYEMLDSACLIGHLETAKWLASTYELRPIPELLFHVCRYGDFGIIQWLASMQTAPAQTWAPGALVRVCTMGFLEIAKWFATFDLVVADALEALIGAAGNAQFAVAEWLVETFGITVSDIRRDHCRVLRKMWDAAPNKMAKDWLVGAFGVTLGDALDALMFACESGSIIEACGVVLGFGLSVGDARASGNAALRATCASGNLNIVKWLFEVFGHTAGDARADENYTLRKACANGHLDVAEWLTETFSLTAADARADDNYALREARAGGHISVAKWLISRFALSPADARARGNHALRTACGSDNAAIVQLLAPLAAFRPDGGAAGSTCVVCLDAPAEAVFAPCAHCVACVGCAAHLRAVAAPCPICRASIRVTVELPGM
jgi:Zinc finger, C3HC4 type (RING finger)/Ankyrin repeats (3 copies)